MSRRIIAGATSQSPLFLKLLMGEQSVFIHIVRDFSVAMSLIFHLN